MNVPFIAQRNNLKILQLTDSHLGLSCAQVDGDATEAQKAAVLDPLGIHDTQDDREQATVDNWHRLCDQFEPDLIIHTGDLWHFAAGEAERYAKARARIDSLGIPWLLCWGNHDRFQPNLSLHEFFGFLGELTEACPNFLNHPPTSPSATEGNFAVSVKRSDSDNCVLRLLVLNNTNDLTSGPYDTNREAQNARWVSFINEVALLPQAPLVLAFHHVPFTQHDQFLQNGGRGMRMVTSAGDGPIDLIFDPCGYDLIRGTPNLRACFCGHLHTRDGSGTTEENIELVFGRFGGFTAPDSLYLRSGAKLITVDFDANTYHWETVFPNGEIWNPQMLIQSNNYQQYVERKFVFGPGQQAIYDAMIGVV